MYLPKLILLFVCFLSAVNLNAQQISGTVYDSTRLYGVGQVLVKTTSGNFVNTDSTGAYQINTSGTDSIFFVYGNKPTQKFPVNKIANQTAFDISLPVRVREKYKSLKEVVIFSKSYKQDSLENRLVYNKGFGYHKPGIVSSSSPGTPPGLDINELIRIFQFRKNKQRQEFQDRLMMQEQEQYVNAKFNSILIKRVTGLEGVELERYKKIYRPDFVFAVTSTEVEFYTYILNSSYEFKKALGL